MALQTIYLEVLPRDIAYVKFIFESYEDVGIIRTVDRKKAIIVLLAVDDFAATARAIVEALKQEVWLQEVPRPEDMNEDWFMLEMANESSQG